MHHTAVTLEEVSFSYGETPAIREVSLTIEAGEYVAIVGRNGSGKSTLGRLINGLLLPDQGVVRTFSMDTSDEGQLKEIRRRAGMVFQNPDNQIVASMVEEDVAFGPENLGIPSAEIRKRVDAALAAVHLKDAARRSPHMLSGGQKQRVAIAGILAMEPDLLLFDESTSMLDPQGRKEMLGIMETLHQKGLTILHVTHSMEEAGLARRILVLDAGEIALDAPSKAFFACHGERAVELGLELPFPLRMAYLLRERGLDLSQPPQTLVQLTEMLCPYL